MGRPAKYESGSMKAIHLRVPLHLIERIEAIAKGERREFSDMVRIIVSDFVKDYDKKKARARG